jgi:C-terminal processing protease CtpA/Prc
MESWKQWLSKEGPRLPTAERKRSSDLEDTGRPADPADLGKLGITVNLDADKRSRLVTAVTKGGPCDEAGIRVGDRIRAIDGDPVLGKDIWELVAYELRGAPDSKVRLELTDADSRNSRSVDVVRVNLFSIPRDRK